MGSVLEGHLNSTEGTNHERIGVIGAPGNELATYLGHNVANDRMVVVAPGMRYADGTTLPAAYTAAAVAGFDFITIGANQSDQQDTHCARLSPGIQPRPASPIDQTQCALRHP